MRDEDIEIQRNLAFVEGAILLVKKIDDRNCDDVHDGVSPKRRAALLGLRDLELSMQRFGRIVILSRTITNGRSST